MGVLFPLSSLRKIKKWVFFIYREEIGLKIKKSTQNRDKNIINNN